MLRCAQHDGPAPACDKRRICDNAGRFNFPRHAKEFPKWLDRLRCSPASGPTCPWPNWSARCSEFGYDGLELACWGDHFEVDKALAQDDYCSKKRELLESNGLQVFAISAHLVGQAVLDNIDARHKAILPPHVWGDGDPAEVNARAANELIATRQSRAKTWRRHCQRLHRIEHLAAVVFLPAGAAGDDRRRLQAAGRAVQPDPRRFRRVRRPVRVGSPSDGNRLRPLLGPAGVRGARTTATSSASTSTRATCSGRASIRWSSSAQFPDRIFHVHMKDAIVTLNGRSGILGSHLELRRSAPRLGFPLAGPRRRELRGDHPRLERRRLQRPAVGRMGRLRHGPRRTAPRKPASSSRSSTSSPAAWPSTRRLRKKSRISPNRTLPTA